MAVIQALRIFLVLLLEELFVLLVGAYEGIARIFVDRRNDGRVFSVESAQLLKYVSVLSYRIVKFRMEAGSGLVHHGHPAVMRLTFLGVHGFGPGADGVQVNVHRLLPPIVNFIILFVSFESVIFLPHDLFPLLIELLIAHQGPIYQRKPVL